ncbi:MAG: hypothetical protein QOE23_1773 [Pseudonocardiales bacterium]|jgi:antitoxin (DNA-binding transcriptional repressor) of toxin-antitoxin stability system|nr:hypothetical protein [Pseudonocardiales bacterium]
MTTIGVRQLRRQTAEFVRRAAAGETIAVLVGGRPVAELGPAHSNRWRRGTEIAAVFAGAPDLDFDLDRDALNNTMTDPFDLR